MEKYGGGFLLKTSSSPKTNFFDLI